mmetsp:Transcript_15120/g.14518  ORF Transcript_15120/g.14518 Transcript_15120/m.14518 type:complete len:423 (+) Transcript_15120:364-1632(+)
MGGEDMRVEMSQNKMEENLRIHEEGVLDISSSNVNEEIDDIDQEGDDKIETTKSTQLHCWQIEMDIVVSDMRAWKAALQPPSEDEESCGDFDDFYAWYMSFLEGNVDIKTDSVAEERRVIWCDLWKHSTPCPALEQKPLFNAEAEAEKIMGFADSLSPPQLASELLIAAIAVVPLMLWAKVQDHVSMATILIKNIVPGGCSKANDVSTALGQHEELKQLCETIFKATEELLLDTTQYGAEERRDTALSQRALLLIDEIAIKTSEIEGYCSKVKTVCESLSMTINAGITMDPSAASILPLMVHNLCTCGTFVSSTKDDAEFCHSLSTIISSCEPKGNDTDSEISSNITDESIKSIPTEGLEKGVSKWTPKERIVKLWFKSGQNTSQNQQQSDLSEQRMRASITQGEGGGSLMVSMRLSEEEFY